MFTEIVIWLQHLIDTFGAFGVFISTFIESLLAPIPSEAVLTLAGTTVDNLFVLIIFIIAASLGNYMGTLPFYLIGYKSKNFVIKFIEKYGKFFLISMNDFNIVEKKFAERGEIMIFLGRLLPGIRSVISFPAGIARMNFLKYSIYTLTGSTLWNIFLLTSGYIFKDYVTTITQILDEYEKIALIIIGLCILLFIVHRIISTRKSRVEK